jgi:hypothetical protein
VALVYAYLLPPLSFWRRFTSATATPFSHLDTTRFVRCPHSEREVDLTIAFGATEGRQPLDRRGRLKEAKDGSF